MAVNIDIRPDKPTWNSLERALRDAADGREVLGDLERSWRAAANVAANDARRSARMIAAPRSRHSVSLRAAIASGVKVHTYLGAKAKGRKVVGGGDAEVAVKWHRSGMGKAVRGKHGRPQSILWRAGWLLNKGRRWTHPTFGLAPNVTTGIPQAKGWFDDSVLPHLPGMAAAVRRAYEEMIARIEARSRG